MTSSNCSTCNKPKANLICGICGDSLCKKCTQVVDENYFSFLLKVPKDLAHTAYCGTCFDQKVSPEIAKYNELMVAAKNTIVFMKAQFKETRLVKRFEDPVRVVDCADHDETILRLAFQAAAKKYNAIIDVDIISKKVKTGNYQTTVFSGTGIPANVREDKLIKDRSNWSSPN